MSVSPFDSILYRDLLSDTEVARLFSDTAQVRALMIVLGALAKVQGDAGVIPELSGAFLHRALMEVQIDPGALTASVGADGEVVPGLLVALRDALQAPEHAQYLGWGATGQDIEDTALMLRLKRGLAVIADRLDAALLVLADLAEAEAETVQAARRDGQVVGPSSFGAMVSVWGAPILRARGRLLAQRDAALCVSLGGKAGTGAHLGPDPGAIRSALSSTLDLRDPGGSWHAERARVADIAGAVGAVTAAGGRMAGDILRLARADVGELRIESHTPSRLRSPVGASAMMALAALSIPQGAALTGVRHGETGDRAAWLTETLILPQLVVGAARAAALVAEVAGGLEIDRRRMAARVAEPAGLIHADALSYAVSRARSPGEARKLLARLEAEARSGGRPLPELVAAACPEIDVAALIAAPDLGLAAQEARGFAAAVRGALAG